MKFSAATVLVAASGAIAGYAHGNVTYTTEVVEVYETYCPEPTTLTYNDKTYTITEATTLTIEDCPCTVTKPIITTSVVECHECAEETHVPPPPPTEETYVPPPPPAANSTIVHVPSATPSVSEVPTAGAGKVTAGLFGLVGLAALAL